MRVTFLGNFGCSWSSETHHAASLEELGVEVARLQEAKAPAGQILAEAERSDALIWIHTHQWQTERIEDVLSALRQRGVPIITYHLDAYMQIPDRWARYQSDPYMLALDHFFSVDQCQADWLNANTTVRGHYLPPGVYGAECYLSDQPSPHANDIVFVGSRGYHDSYPMRPRLLDWLKQTYGKRFTHAGGDSGTGPIRGDDLNRLYTSSKIAIGDSYIADPDYPGKYWSDRVPESCGRGAFALVPRVFGLNESFTDGEHLITYEHGDFDDLRAKIDYYLEHDDEREKIRLTGHEHAKANHSYTQRWETILDTVFA